MKNIAHPFSAQRDRVLYVRNSVIYQLTGYRVLLLQSFQREYANLVREKVTDRHLLIQSGNVIKNLVT